jgi:hypothetical protein
LSIFINSIVLYSLVLSTPLRIGPSTWAKTLAEHKCCHDSDDCKEISFHSIDFSMNYLFSYFYLKSIISTEEVCWISDFLDICEHIIHKFCNSFRFILAFINAVWGRAFPTIFFVLLSTKLNLKVPSL